MQFNTLLIALGAGSAIAAPIFHKTTETKRAVGGLPFVDSLPLDSVLKMLSLGGGNTPAAPAANNLMSTGQGQTQGQTIPGII